jgi:FkbM family methyltransferase
VESALLEMKRLMRAPGRLAKYATRKALRPPIIRHFGARLALDTGVLSPTIVESLYKGGYEGPEVDIIRATLTPDDRVLEIGGGIGFVGIISSQIVRRPEQVLIVEANPQLIPLMERNFELNDVRPQVRNAVLGRDGAREVSFYLHDDFWASSLIAFPGARETRVPQLDIDDVFREFQPTYLIVDIEGGEIALFDGLALDGIQKLCLEVHPGQTGQPAVDALIASLERQGFVIARTSRLHNVVFLQR